MRYVKSANIKLFALFSFLINIFYLYLQNNKNNESMKRKLSKTTGLRAALVILVLVNSCKTQSVKEDQGVDLEREYKGPQLTPQVPNFNQFREAVGFRESSNNYSATNRFGYIGKYQFGKLALIDLGIKDQNKFLQSPSIQDEAFLALCRINKYRLRNSIKIYVGRVINGISITESGLLASAHLVGSNAVKRYLSSNGQNITRDGNQVSIEEYLHLFRGYDLEIEAKRNINLAV